MNKIKKQNIAYRQPYICKKKLLSANCYGLKSSTCFKTILVFFSLVVLVCIDIIKIFISNLIITSIRNLKGRHTIVL